MSDQLAASPRRPRWPAPAPADSAVQYGPHTGPREVRPDARGPAGDLVVAQVMEKIGWGLRAVRHPLPSRQEVERMVRESCSETSAEE